MVFAHRGGAGVDAGFLCDNFQLTLAPGERTEIAGPLFYSEQKDTQHQWTLPPLFSHTLDTDADSEEDDFLYPLLTYDRFGSEYRFQILQLFSFAGGQNQKEEPQRRFSLFPFYFQQRSPNPALNYTALFPIYGHLVNRMIVRDDIRFVLFPLYLQTRKRDMVTDNYLFPLLHLRHGNGLQGWQFWPLVGHETKSPGVKTNLADEIEIIPGHDRWFAVWPLIFNQYSNLGTTNEGHEVTVLPFYSQFRSPSRDATTVLWPFFTVIDERGEKKYREWELPYPFIVFARGPGKTTSRVWPFYGTARDDHRESDFYLWPIYKYNRLQSDPLDRERTRIFFFLYSDIIQRNTATEKFLRRTDFWPLFTYHRDYNGDARLQILAPIEPILPNNKSIERNWSPLWSLWRAEESGADGRNSQSLFWNFYRRQADVTSEKISLAFGLLRYQSGMDGSKWRVLFVPFGKAEPAAKFQSLPAPVTNGLPPILHPRYDLLPST